MDKDAWFLNALMFTPAAASGFPQSDPDATRRDVEQYLLAFDTDLAPIVGQQVTLTSANSAAAGPRVDLLLQRAGRLYPSAAVGGFVNECDVVAQVVQNGSIVGYVYDPQTGVFTSRNRVLLSDSGLRALAQTPGQEVTYTAATPGSGERIISGLPAAREMSRRLPL